MEQDSTEHSAAPPQPPSSSTAEQMKALFQRVFDERVANGDSPTSAAAAALRTVKAELGQTTSAADEDRDGDEEKTRSGTDSSMGTSKEGEEEEDPVDLDMEDNVSGSLSPNTDSLEPRHDHDPEQEQEQVPVQSGKSIVLSNPVQVVPDVEMKKPVEAASASVEVEVRRDDIAMDCCDNAGGARVEVLTLEKLRSVITEGKKEGSLLAAIHLIGRVFSEPAVLQESFYVDAQDSVDLQSIATMYVEILAQPELVTPLESSLWNLASTCATKPSINTLKESTPLLVGLLAPQYYFATEQYEKIVGMLLRGLINRCSKDMRKTITAYFERLCKEDFDRLLEIVQSYLTIKTLTVNEWQDAKFSELRHAVEFLDMLYNANAKTKFHPWIDFYQDGINHLMATNHTLLQDDHGQWFVNRVAKGEVEGVHTRRSANPERVSYCEFPYLLDTASKAKMLELEVHELQLIRRRMNENRIILLQIRREHIVDDALDQVQSIPRDMLTSALHVKFEGEDGIDEGGVRKEFFLILTRKLFVPSFGMFVESPETRLLWFNPNSLETPVQFEFVGILIGLAIYNSVILDVRFPKVLYKMLLGSKPTLQDLKELDPQLGGGLQSLLDFEGDVESTFCRTFSLTFDVYGEKRTVQLKQDGEKIHVTNANREEYVDLYVEYHLEKSVQKQFEAFNKGFHNVCDDGPLSMFRAEELEMVICGNPVLDFDELEQTACYDNGYSRESQTIQWFWRTVHELSEEDKKKFLMFTTGTDRVPLRGLGDLQLTISKNGREDSRLPSAHTCFNHLLLPEYSSEEVLKAKLLLAISHSEGFGTL